MHERKEREREHDPLKERSTGEKASVFYASIVICFVFCRFSTTDEAVSEERDTTLIDQSLVSERRAFDSGDSLMINSQQGKHLCQLWTISTHR